MVVDLLVEVEVAWLVNTELEVSEVVELVFEVQLSSLEHCCSDRVCYLTCSLSAPQTLKILHRQANHQSRPYHLLMCFACAAWKSKHN